MPTIQTRYGPVTFSDTGSGSTVILLHATLHDRHDFDAVLPALEAAHRVIAVDWPGHGGSPSPGVEPTAASFADVLVDVVEGLDLPPAAIIGNSVGGFAAARLAITHPERVSRLVLVDTGGFLSGPVTNLYCRAMGTTAITKRVLPRFIRGYLKPRTNNDRAIESRAVARARTAEGIGLAAALWRSFASAEYNLRPEAGRITVPTLVIWGSEDTAIPLRFGRSTAAVIPGSRFEVLPTGHVPFSSEPDGFLAITLPFLAEGGSAAGQAGFRKLT